MTFFKHSLIAITIIVVANRFVPVISVDEETSYYIQYSRGMD